MRLESFLPTACSLKKMFLHSLKGTFSRLAHQSNLYLRKPGATSHILTSLTLQLPPGISSPYYLDVIGNVSTSRFRPSTPPASAQVTKLKRQRQSAFSLIELTPRYPLVGGWNYSFTLGWNVQASEWLKRDPQEGKYLLKVPMFTVVKDLAIDEATLRVRLPEGARYAASIKSTPSRVELTNRRLSTQ